LLNRTPICNKEFVANPAERILEGEEPPTGGFGWDGRFGTLHDQATFPLLAPNEMANASPGQVDGKMRLASYAGDFRNAFGVQVFDDTGAAYKDALLALERFELETRVFILTAASMTTTSAARSH
jgi:cytochrome c peroxidase